MATIPLRASLSRLQRRFSPRRTRLGNSTPLELDGGRSEALVCVVGRELCLFTAIDATKVPARQRDAFVRMTVRRIAPFPDPDFDVFWSHGHAAVWYWPRSRIMERAGGSLPRRVAFVAEAVLTGEPQPGDTVQLLGLVEGCEGRIWDGGRLVASRWWPEPPAQAGWAMFLRGAGRAVTDVPRPVEAPIGLARWRASDKVKSQLSLAGLDSLVPKLALGLVVAVTFATTVELGMIARNEFEGWRARRAAQALDSGLQQILQARERAEANVAEIDAFLGLRPPKPQVALLADVSRLLDGKDWRLRVWNQPSPGNVEATLLLPNANPEELVTSWEASPMFTQVTTDISGRPDEITIRARVAGAPESPP